MSETYDENDLTYPMVRRSILERVEAFATRDPKHLRKWVHPTDYDTLYEAWADLADSHRAVDENNVRLIGEALRSREEAEALRVFGERFRALADAVGVYPIERPDLYISHPDWPLVMKAARVALAKMTDGTMDPWHKPTSPPL